MNLKGGNLNLGTLYSPILSLKCFPNPRQDMEGKVIGRGMGYKLKDLSSLEEGSTLPVGGKEVEVSDYN